MHNVIFATAPGPVARLARCLTASALVLLTATPALAQDATQGRTGSVLNILLLALIAYFLVRAFRRRSGGGDNSRPGQWSRPDDPSRTDDASASREDGRAGGDQAKPVAMDRHEAARRTWDMLSSQGQDKPVPTTPTGAPARVDGFDESEFLEGAKLLFSRFQQARNKDDFDAIRDFLSDGVYSDALAAGDRPRTDVMLVSARLVELKTEGGRTAASVRYDAQLRVGEEGRPVELRTVWEFSSSDSVLNGLWVLEKINPIVQ
ncbi:Tim44 domain-containing protein [Desulfovibrio sp. Fe33]|uniref:Tim44 domain-containing protein n=1 Tax=Desulfovibrio sp. Fe33 TaxID=3020842 RepID=UPI00234E1D4B|nr:Tim44-like domain-containing protein [Desulfovibrio sp. Fe33]